MAVLAAILPVVGRSSSLALQLYKRAATVHDEAATDLTQLAKSIRAFSSVLKQVGTIIKEDDLLTSHEAIEVLENIIYQSRSVFLEIEECVFNNDSQNAPRQNGTMQYSALATDRLTYLRAHLEALRATMSVMLQTLHTAQSIMWSQLEPAVSPKKVEEAVSNEKTQLETVIIEQQSAILSAIQAYNSEAAEDTKLLMEADSSQSLILSDAGSSPRPSDLYGYQDKFIASLETTKSHETEWLPSICSIAVHHSDMLLDRWSSLPEFYQRMRDAEREARTHQREALQPMVEMAAKAQKPDYEPLLTEVNGSSAMKRDTRYGPTAPLSPAASPRTSRQSVTASSNDQDSPTSPRSSISSLPVEATAAVEAKEEDDDVDLEIPWTLCTRKHHYWRYVDNRVVKTNSDDLPSIAFLERNSWTEIMASWVCKESIREAGLKFTQVQKERRDGRRTRFETCFCIEQPLQFQQVKQLVERTVQIYRQSKPETPPPTRPPRSRRSSNDPGLPPPPPRVRRSSFNRQPAPPLSVSYANPIDRDRTPIPSRPTQPPLDRSTTALHVPSNAPPRLDRSLSNPGISSIPMPIPGPPHTQKTHPSGLQIPMPPPQYSTSMPQGPYPLPPPQPPYSPMSYNPKQPIYPPPPPATASLPGPPPLPPHMQPHNMSMPQSPLRQTHLHPHSRSKYDDDFTTDSDSTDRERRRQRSKDRSRYTERKKKSHNKSKAAGAVLGVGGLTALLDGLSGL